MATNKICNFDILLDECFINFNPDRTKISPDENDFLLSVINGFEDDHWLRKNFQNFIFNNIAMTALTAEERQKCIEADYSALTESAKHLRLVDDNGKGSEIAEIVLYGIMKHHFNAISAIPKIFYKQNDQDNAKGADAVHIVIIDDNDFQLWLGEAKFYNNLEDARFYEPIKSVNQMLTTKILRKELSILTSINELYNQLDKDMATRVKNALSGDCSIDDIKNKIHVPILLLHECQITAGTKRLTDDYKNAIIAYHKDRAISYFKAHINKLSQIPNYENIQFHLILFPVPDKGAIVEWFLKRAKDLKDDADC